MSAPLKVVVVGAGLGGLTAAIALRKRGIDVSVLEQSSELGEIGAGVQLAPNAMRVARELGLEQDVLAASYEPNRHVIRSWRSGRELAATQLNMGRGRQRNALEEQRRLGVALHHGDPGL